MEISMKLRHSKRIKLLVKSQRDLLDYLDVPFIKKYITYLVPRNTPIEITLDWDSNKVYISDPLTPSITDDTKTKKNKNKSFFSRNKNDKHSHTEYHIIYDEHHNIFYYKGELLNETYDIAVPPSRGKYLLPDFGTHTELIRFIVLNGGEPTEVQKYTVLAKFDKIFIKLFSIDSSYYILDENYIEIKNREDFREKIENYKEKLLDEYDFLIVDNGMTWGRIVEDGLITIEKKKDTCSIFFVVNDDVLPHGKVVYHRPFNPDVLLLALYDVGLSTSLAELIEKSYMLDM